MQKTQNPVEQKKRFHLLLQQIGLTDDPYIEHLRSGQIEKLVVDRINQKWHFYFIFERILPFQIYEHFTRRLEQSFQHIARVQFSLSISQTTITDQLVADYWQGCLKEIEGMSPMLLSLLHHQTPKVDGNKIIVQVRNDMEARTLQEKYGKIITEVYQYFGFPSLLFSAEVRSESESSEEYAKFVEAKRKEDEERARQAVLEMQKLEQERRTNEGEAPSGPLMLGYAIKNGEEMKRLEEIVDEERRVTVEGYVFQAETRELRSGRTLLTFKMTDYTDSISVKMFSKDNEDASIMASLKKACG